MKILAISGSPRTGRMIHSAIEAILQGCTNDCKVISLAGKNIGGCRGCAACAGDNVCKVRDDWNEIGDAMQAADLLIFGAPNYFGMVNALAHATLERTFCFRHRGANLLQGKRGLVVSTCRNREADDPVAAYIRKMFRYNYIEEIGAVQVTPYNQCYTCGYGHDCAQGAVVGRHGVLSEILPCHLPPEVPHQAETLAQIEAVRGIMRENGVSL